MEKDELEPADWGKLLSSAEFVNLEVDKEKVLLLEMPARMRSVQKFGRKDDELVMHCIEEDGEPVDKNFTTLSRRLLMKLRPFIEAAEKEKATKLRVSVLRVGDSYQTQYSVKRLPA